MSIKGSIKVKCLGKPDMGLQARSSDLKLRSSNTSAAFPIFPKFTRGRRKIHSARHLQ